MMKLRVTTQFKKDYKRMKKQGRSMNLLQEVMDTLLAEKVLDEKHRDHLLTGNYIGFREYHDSY